LVECVSGQMPADARLGYWSDRLWLDRMLQCSSELHTITASCNFNQFKS